MTSIQSSLSVTESWANYYVRLAGRSVSLAQFQRESNGARAYAAR